MSEKIIKIWAIGDLHLSVGLAPDKAKPMNIFGSKWHHHDQTIADNWRARVHADDIVLIPGDICWANKLSDALHTIEWLHQLPGRKVILRGNHDNWWQSINRLRESLPEDIFAIHFDSVVIDDIAFCGARGWSFVDDIGIEHQDKMMNRELLRLESSLADLPSFARAKIALMHFPPFPGPGHSSDFVDLLLAHRIDCCVYGHLHGVEASRYKKITVKNTEFHLVSADYLDFSPMNIYNVSIER